MPVPSNISELSQTPASNSPVGTVDVPSSIDDYQRTHAAFIATLRDGKGFTSSSALASGATTDIGSQNALFVDISGTTTITSFGTTFNGPRFLRFAGALTLTHNATTLILPGGANVITAAGDTLIAIPKTTAAVVDGWVVIAYLRNGDAGASHANDIINGDFRIVQAGTSFAAPANGAYDLDGWLNGNASAAVFTIAQVAGSTSGRLARQSTITTADAAVAAGDVVTDSTRIEGYNVEKYVGKTFTVAGRAKVPVTGIHCVSLRNSGLDRSYVKEINFTVANTWTDFSFTVTGGLPTAGTWNYTTGLGLDISFAHMAGTTFQTTADAWNTGNFLGTANQVNDCATIGNVWALEKVTMNLGTVAAVSEISVEQDLVRCQRYYAVTYIGLRGTSGVSSVLGGTFELPVQMRANPTLTLAGSPTFSNVSSETLSNLLTPNPAAFSYQLDATVANTDTFVVDRRVIAAARL